jgi:hypothetical protein
LNWSRGHIIASVNFVGWSLIAWIEPRPTGRAHPLQPVSVQYPQLPSDGVKILTWKLLP